MIVTRCKVSHTCCLCRRWLRRGEKAALDYETHEWVHVSCLVDKIQKKSSENASLDE